MCIQWCCKNCLDQLTVLTHHWARERCNDYYIARSEDYTVTDCPRGPWVLQRAYHRNPYKGAQRCDDCKRAGRKDSKRVQIARQRTNIALGERREYSGALNVGELVIPDGFQHTPQNTPQLPVGGQLDAIESTREDFALANEQLPSHELERDWAAKFAESNVGVGSQSMANASAVQMNAESATQITALAETDYRSPYQPVQHHPMHNIYTGTSTVGGDDSRNMDPYTESTLPESDYIKLAAGASQGSFQEIPYGNDFTTYQNTGAAVQGQAYEEHHRGAQHRLSLPMHASSSRSTRIRPWDL